MIGKPAIISTIVVPDAIFLGGNAMKSKLKALVIVTTVLVSLLSGCGSSEDSNLTESSAAPAIAVETKPAEEPAPTPVEEAEPEPTPDEIINEAMTEGLNLYFGRNGKNVDMEQALAAFEKAADAGGADAYYYIGRILYWDGKYNDAITALNKGIDLGSDLARLGLGYQYVYESGVEEDFSKAKDLYEEAVRNGCTEAKYGLGELYLKGWGVDADADKALEYLEAAVGCENDEIVGLSALELFVAYCGQYGIEKDDAKKSEYEAKVCEIGERWNPVIIYWMGNSCLDLDDIDSAISFFEMAGDAGYADSYELLGRIYVLGNLVQADPNKGLVCFQKAADMGNGQSMANIGYLYRSGTGVEQDTEKAIEWYEKAGMAGESTGFQWLGDMYKEGYGVDVDYVKAEEYYEKAAELGAAEAVTLIGCLYEDGGHGLTADYAKAKECYEKAADMGDAAAYCNLGMMYFSGNGVDIDLDKAYEYLDKSAELGNETAINNIKGMVKDGIFTKEKAQKWIK